MNVTSLLNTSGAAQAAAGRLPQDASGAAMYQSERVVPMRTSSEPRVPNRSRTPWDAGGYSLPLTLNIKNAQNSSASKLGFFEAPPVESAGGSSPKSPKHKFSDSRSSLSSYTTMSSNNSCHSRSHSRISSLSTVSEYQPLSSFGSDSTPTERRTSDPDSAMLCPTVVEVQPPSPASRRSGMDDFSPDGSDNESPRNSDRPRSPSDAILMRNRGLTGSVSPSDSKIINSLLRPDSPSSTSTSRAHKRTASAPDFPSLSNISSRSHFPAFRPMAEPTPPKSPTGEDRRRSTGSDSISPVTPDETQPIQNPTPSSSIPPEPRCMFVSPCTTGSSLRKAISHIFGRNKLCTKSIPSNIWVHYCRKHYQRSRYRNATDYALRQVDLVLLQIQKVQEWSDDNVKVNRRGDGVLKHWTLQARKREAKRLQESDSRKRRYADDDDDDAALSSGTAIPDWLQDKLNQDYDTPKMLEIIEDVKRHMGASDIQQIPDIEILPEIMTDGNESRPKATVRRTGNNSGHRHTKSEVYRSPPSMSSAFHTPRAGMSSFQDHKRFRTGASPYNMPVHNLSHRPVMSMNQAYPYGIHNGGFATIAENQSDAGFWSTPSYGPNGVLPAPVPQRHFSTPMTPESANVHNSYTPQGRPMHARSMSENPVLHSAGHGHTGFRPFPSQSNQTYQQQAMFSNFNTANGYGSQPAHGGYDEYGMPQNDPHAYWFGRVDEAPEWETRNSHARVQNSSSMGQTPMQRSASMAGGPPPMTSSGAPSMLPSMANMGTNMYSGQQHMGLPSVHKEVGYGDYQAQTSHRY